MRKYKVPFRVGHHFSSDIVNHGKQHNIKPLDFPYAEAKRIFKEAIKDFDPRMELPMSEAEFKSTLNPISIVQNRATVGGPQASEMKRMLALAKDKLKAQQQWTAEKRQKINQAMALLEKDFQRLLQP